MEASEITNIPIDRPELLFKDPSTIKDDFKALAKKWHPDHSGGMADVFAHINILYEEAKTKSNLLWDNGTVVDMTTITGARFRMKYQYRNTFELGTYYVSRTTLMYVVNKRHKEIFNNALYTMKPVFPDNKMATELKRFLPDLNTTLELKDHLVMVLNKTPDVVPLRWVIEKYGKVPPKQAAWMLSSILNLCCALQVSGGTHNEISPDTLFVSIKHHSGLLLGGWWYSGKEGDKLELVPARTHKHMSRAALIEKKHSLALGIDLAKATIAEVLGDASGVGLRKDPDIPPEFISFLLQPVSDNDAFKVYKQWKSTVLPSMKYKKEFILWDIPQKDLLS